MFRQEQPFKAVFETDHFPTQLVRCQDNAAQDRIQSRAISSARQDADPRLHHWLGPPRICLAIHGPSGCRPTIVERPAAVEQGGAFA